MYKVMLVDDEVWVLRGLEGIIDWHKMGFKIVGKFTNAKDALDKLKESDVDVLITDIRMGGISGLELMKMALEVKSGIKFVVVSGYSEFTYAKKALQLGALDYLLKPITEEELKKVLIKVKKEIESKKKSLISVKSLNW